MKFHALIQDGKLFTQSRILISPWSMQVVEIVRKYNWYEYGVIVQWYGEQDRFPHCMKCDYARTPVEVPTIGDLIYMVEEHRKRTYMSPEWYAEGERLKIELKQRLERNPNELAAYYRQHTQ